MLKNRYEIVFWGQTPWGLLHALLWRTKQRDVLVIDDHSLSTASGGHRWLTQIEMQLLRELGTRYQITPLDGLENFLRPATLKLQTPALQWVSGATVRDNLREFVRKFSCFQTPLLLAALEAPEIEEDYRKFARAYLDWFRSPVVRHRGAAKFSFSSAPWLAEFQQLLTQELTKSYLEPRDGALAQLLAAYASVTLQLVKYDFQPVEAPYLMLRLLSPHWELDERWFERELARELLKLGAHIKRTRIQSWQIWDQKIEAALLDSYEGVVAHDRLVMYGFPASDGSLQCEFSEKVFRGLETLWPLDKTRSLEETRPEICALTSPRLIGTDIPVLILEEGPQEVRLQVLVEERPGAKPEFYRQEALETAAPLVASSVAAWAAHQRGTSWDLWIEAPARNATKAVSHLHERRSVKIVDRVEKLELAGVDYWGPLMTQRFGLLGYLTELTWDLH